MYSSLHNHSHYSNIRVLDSIMTEEKLIDRAFELGLKAVAITDHETLSAHVKAINYYNKKYEDKKDQFKLILGNEIYLTRSGLNTENHQKGEKFYHMLLLAKDAIGHRQLRELSTRAWGRSYYKNMMRTPTFVEDLQEIIGKNPGHIVATTACLASYPGSMFMMNEHDQIRPHLEMMANIFGMENFFVEIQPSFNVDQIAYNRHMIINFWDDYNFIFTTDSHYLRKEDQETHRLFLQSKGGASREVNDYYSSAYMMSWEEVLPYFNTYISMPKIEMMRLNTNKIADMIQSYSLDHGQIVPKIKYEHNRFDWAKISTIQKLFGEIGFAKYPYLEKFLTEDNEANLYLINLVLEGYFNKVYRLRNVSQDGNTTEQRMSRLNYELEQVYETSVHIEQSLSDYFITMSKIIDIVWNEADSLVGPGRGSAGGFLINYLIGITQIDPMTQSLYLPPWRLTEGLHIRRDINRV